MENPTIEVKTVGGWTREEWLRYYIEKHGHSEEAAAKAVAIGFEDVPGDVINVDEHPDFKE